MSTSSRGITIVRDSSGRTTFKFRPEYSNFSPHRKSPQACPRVAFLKFVSQLSNLQTLYIADFSYDSFPYVDESQIDFTRLMDVLSQLRHISLDLNDYGPYTKLLGVYFAQGIFQSLRRLSLGGSGSVQLATCAFTPGNSHPHLYDLSINCLNTEWHCKHSLIHALSLPSQLRVLSLDILLLEYLYEISTDKNENRILPSNLCSLSLNIDSFEEHQVRTQPLGCLMQELSTLHSLDTFSLRLSPHSTSDSRSETNFPNWERVIQVFNALPLTARRFWVRGASFWEMPKNSAKNI